MQVLSQKLNIKVKEGHIMGLVEKQEKIKEDTEKAINTLIYLKAEFKRETGKYSNIWTTFKMEKISAVAFIFKLFLLLAWLWLLFPIWSDYFFSGEKYQDKSEEDS